MRPLTDRFGISREKLSYVVDSTAAPVAAVAFITTWIGAELSYIQSAVEVINSGTGHAIAEGPYQIFFQSLPWSFYPFLTLGFVGMVIWTRRDFGPMRQAEMGSGGLRDSLDPAAQPMTDAAEEIPELSSGITPRALNALIPVMIVIVGVIAGLLVTGIQSTGWDGDQGFGRNISTIIGQADSFKALLWASFAGLTIAILLSVSQRLLTLRQATDSMIKGFKTMLSAMMILVLAWSLAALTAQLHTANFLAQIMMQLQVAPPWLPVITFVLAALVSFSTGSSWGTMAILYPLLLPTSWQLFHDFNLAEPEAMRLFHAVVASVLAGSVLGDHCSPISDTTILSSLATGCDHISHVKTQLPYALTVGGSYHGGLHHPLLFRS
jgi:Na+/H+ antiporter NhaC